MKKLVPWIRLGVFCALLFGMSALGILLKQGRILTEKKADAEAGAEPAGSAAATAGIVGDGNPLEGAAANGAAGGTEAALKGAALQKGRALFDLPEPISIADASELMNELSRQQVANEQMRIALEQQSRELASMEREIETRRTEVLALTDQLKLRIPLAAVTTPGEGTDPATVGEIAAIAAGMTADAAAKFLATMPLDKAALLLLRMEKEKAAEVLGQFESEKLTALTQELLRAKLSEEE